MSFDLIEYQQKAKSTTDPKKLFELWEEVCRLYDQGKIGRYELDEMKDIICPDLRAIASIKKILTNRYADCGCPVCPKCNQPCGKTSCGCSPCKCQ